MLCFGMCVLRFGTIYAKFSPLFRRYLDPVVLISVDEASSRLSMRRALAECAESPPSSGSDAIVICSDVVVEGVMCGDAPPPSATRLVTRVLCVVM